MATSPKRSCFNYRHIGYSIQHTQLQAFTKPMSWSDFSSAFKRDDKNYVKVREDLIIQVIENLRSVKSKRLRKEIENSGLIYKFEPQSVAKK